MSSNVIYLSLAETGNRGKTVKTKNLVQFQELQNILVYMHTSIHSDSVQRRWIHCKDRAEGLQLLLTRKLRLCKL